MYDSSIEVPVVPSMSAESGGEPGPCVVAQVAQKLEDHVLDLGSSCRPGPFSPLHIAAVRDDAVLAKKILADCEPAAIPPLLREDESCTGSCALTVAAEYGSLAFLREVVQHVGDLASVLLPVYQSNMLGGAARNGHADVVDLLLSSFKRNRQNGDLDFKHNDQIAVSPFKHALSAALLSGHGHIAQKILRHAAPWPEADEASLLAAKNCDIQTLEGLAEAVTDFGKTRGANVALVLAAISGCDEAAKVLLGAGVNPNNGHSVAFHFPALADPHGLCHVCDFLPGGRHRSDRPGVCDFLPSGIIEAFQKRGMVAYAGALAAGHGKIMKMLDDNGAAPHAAYSVLFAAIAVKNSSVARQCLRTFGMLLAPQAMGQIYAEGLLFSLLAGNSEMVRFFMTLEFEMDGKSGPLLSSCQRLKELFEWIEPETSTNDDRPITVRQTVLGEYSVFLPEMTPLMFAIGIGNADLAATLIEGGANVSIAIPGVGDALCMLCDLHMKNPQIAFDRRKDPATPRERTFTGQPWWKEWIFDDDTGLWIDNPDFNRNWRDNDEDCRDRAESAAQNAAHLWGHFLEVRRSFSEAEVQRSFQRLCGLLLKNGVDAHKKHIGLSSSIFGSVCSRMADEICGVRGRNGVSGIGACYIFRTFLESGVLISVANLDFVIPAFFSLTEFSEFLLAVKNRPDAVSILLRIWIGDYGGPVRLGEREVKQIGDLLRVLWQHPELKDFDINSKVQGEAGAVGDTPRRVPGEGVAAAVRRDGIIAAFLENYAGLLAMLQRGAKFPPMDMEGLQLGDVAADAQNVHTTYHQRHLAGHVEEARATIGRPLTPLDQEHFFMHLEELSDENIERIRADVANARGRRLPEIRVALVVSARRVFGIVAGEAGAMIGGGDAMALVFRRLEHDARAHGEDMESYVVGPIAQGNGSVFFQCSGGFHFRRGSWSMILQICR